MGLNHNVIMGRLVADPELRRTGTGKAVVSFTVACDKPGKDSGASFIPCVAWEKTGEFINNFFNCCYYFSQYAFLNNIVFRHP